MHRWRSGGTLLRDPPEEGPARGGDHRLRAQQAGRHLRLGRRVLGRDAGRLRGGRSGELRRDPPALRLLDGHRDVPRDGAGQARVRALDGPRVLRAVAPAALADLHARARELGVRLEFEREVRDELDVGPADLVLVADGINSLVRTKHAAHFRPEIEWRKCKFAWFGTTRPLEAFTFVFRSSEHGLFQVHAYPFQRGAEPLSTWIVECHEDVWKRAGFERASEQETVRYLEDLFAPDLDGHALLTNKSVWRSFPVVRCGTWVRGNAVLVGDAAHTAHFSIGSGTKLAMEDAIELVAALRDEPRDVPAALKLYEERRSGEVARLQKAARTSMEWFETCARYVKQPPLEFTFNLMRSEERRVGT